jgi:translation initiation factor IF-3
MMKKNKEFIEIKDVLLRVNLEEKRLKARLKEIQDFKMNALLILSNPKMYNELRGNENEQNRS